MFENTTVYDKATVRVTAFVWMRKMPRASELIQRRRHTVFGGVEAVAGGLLILLGFVSPPDNQIVSVFYRLIGVTAFVTGVLLLFRRPLSRRFIEWGIPWSLRKRGEPLELRRTFHEDFFWSSTEGGRQYGYETLKAVYEVNGFFVFEMTDRWGTLDLSGFTRGTPEDFRDFLERKLGRPVERIQ